MTPHCPQPGCNLPLDKVPSGWICVQAHGRIYSDKQAKGLYAKQKRDTLPAARRIEGLGVSRWYVIGHPGIWSANGVGDGSIRAHTGEREIELWRDEELEHAIQAALTGNAP